MDDNKHNGPKNINCNIANILANNNVLNDGFIDSCNYIIHIYIY